MLMMKRQVKDTGSSIEEITRSSESIKSQKQDYSPLMAVVRPIKQAIDQHSTESRMMLRRRLINQSEMNERSVQLSMRKTTYLPQEQLSLSTSLPKGFVKSSSKGEGERIFSITSSVVILTTIGAVFGLFYLSNSNKALFVNAQFSSLPSYQNVNGADQNQIRSPFLGRQGSVNQQLLMPVAGHSKQNTVNLDMEDQRNKAISIDRFDSGEQIRPPLLRQPTTLAPIVSSVLKQQNQQVNSLVNSALNLNAAASQDSFMSPEEREQLLKQHESHYEGKSYLDQQPSTDSAAALQSNRRRSQVSENLPAHFKGGSLQGEASSDAGKGASEADDGDYDDGDGSESAEGSAAAKKQQMNQGPDNRRSWTASGNKEAGQLTKPIGGALDSSNADESNDLTEDYGGSNDDAYFSRKSAQPTVSANLAASHNLQSRNSHYASAIQGNQNAGPGKQQYSAGTTGSSLDSPEESQGFGPGPNEAYMVDKAESAAGGKNSLDQDDEGNFNGPNGAGDILSGLDDDDAGTGRGFDRRSMSEKDGNRPLNQFNSASSIDEANGGGRGLVSAAAAATSDASDPDSDDGSDSDSSDEPGAAFAPSSKVAQVNSLRPSASGSVNTIDKTRLGAGATLLAPKAASVNMLAPQSTNLVLSADSRPANFPLGVAASAQPLALKQQQAQTIQVLGVHSGKPASLADSFNHHRQRGNSNAAFGAQQNQQQNNLIQQQKLHQLLPQQQQLMQQSNLMNLMSLQQQKPTSAPYNPQNNPSHVGKYFIN